MWLLRNILFYVLNFIVFQFSCANYLNNFETWYSKLVFFIGAGLLFFIMLLKWRNKWTGILTLNKNAAKYKLNYSVRLSRKFMKWTYLFYGIEIVVSLVFPLVYMFFDTLTWPFSCLLFFNGIEGLYYLVVNTKKGKFKIAMNENALVHNARGTTVIPFHDLKSIEYKYDEYFFIYTTGEAISIPEYVVEDANLVEFRKVLSDLAKNRGIFYSDKLTN